MPDHDVDAGGGGGGGGVDGTQCTNHPNGNTSSPGGICALCLQDKLGKLVSSSSSSFLPTSSPSFRSLSSTSTSSTLTLHPLPSSSSQPHRHPVSDVTMRHSHNASGSHFPYLLSHHTKKSSTDVSDVVLKRSQSSATPSSFPYNDGLTPRRRGFWSFLHLSSAHYKQQDRPKAGPGPTQTEVTQLGLHGRKVWRSRSIGCGSRNFSSDFFDRISTGFADCAFCRVDANPEGRRSSTSSARDILCGGLFSGFIITSSSSSYWTAIADEHNVNAKPNGPNSTPGAGPLVHGQSRSWGRALATPMRVFTKPVITSTTIKRTSTTVGGANNNGNETTKAPNLAHIPSLLSVR